MTNEANEPPTSDVPASSSVPSRLARALSIGFIAVLMAALFAVVVGAQGLSITQVLEAIREEGAARTIVSVRVARIALSALVGSSLAAVGATLQSLLRNPLADPYVLGTSGGAACSATLAIGLGFASAQDVFVLPLWAFFGAFGATLFVAVIARRTGSGHRTDVILAGIVVNAFASAMITFIKVIVSPNQAQQILYWLVGSIGYEPASTLVPLAVYLGVGTLALFVIAPSLNALALGDDVARTLGIQVERVRGVAFVATAAIVAGVVAFAGLVGFVGLVVPHAVRLVVGGDQRIVLPASTLCGAAFLIASDALARGTFVLLGTEPPVGAITALIGCPLFLWLLRGTGHRSLSH